MMRCLACWACCLLIGLGQPAFASPKSDAEFIAEQLVTDADFKETLREMCVTAYASKIASALLARSVKVKDEQGFIALLPASLCNSMISGMQQALADKLLNSTAPEQLKSLVDYLPRRALDANAQSLDTPAVVTGQTPTLQELPQEIYGLLDDETFKNENALSAAAVDAFFVMAQKTYAVQINLNAPFVITMLEADGVFSFPNRIFRNDLIRALRASQS